MWYTCPCCDGAGYTVGELRLNLAHPFFEAIKCEACEGKGRQFVFHLSPQPFVQPSTVPYWPPYTTWTPNQTLSCEPTSNVA